MRSGNGTCTPQAHSIFTEPTAQGWMVQRGNSETELSITTEHGKGDAAVRGPASELQLWVWGRPVTDIEIFGDSAVAEAWRNLAP